MKKEYCIWIWTPFLPPWNRRPVRACGKGGHFGGTPGSTKKRGVRRFLRSQASRRRFGDELPGCVWFVSGSGICRGRFVQISVCLPADRGVVAGYSPQIEQASVDEFYLDVTGCERMFGVTRHWRRISSSALSSGSILPGPSVFPLIA